MPREILIIHNPLSGVPGTTTRAVDHVLKNGKLDAKLSAYTIQKVNEWTPDQKKDKLNKAEDIVIAAGDGTICTLIDELGRINGRIPNIFLTGFGGENFFTQNTTGLKHDNETLEQYLKRQIRELIEGKFNIEQFNSGKFTEDGNEEKSFIWFMTPSDGITAGSLNGVEVLRPKLRGLFRRVMGVFHGAMDLHNRHNPVEVSINGTSVKAAEATLVRPPLKKWGKLSVGKNNTTDIVFVAANKPNMSPKAIALGAGVDMLAAFWQQRRGEKVRSVTGVVTTYEVPIDKNVVFHNMTDKPSVGVIDSEIMKERGWQEIVVSPQTQNGDLGVPVYVRPGLNGKR